MDKDFSEESAILVESKGVSAISLFDGVFYCFIWANRTFCFFSWREGENVFSNLDTGLWKS